MTSETSPVYRKSDSFVEIRDAGTGEADILDRVRSLDARLRDRPGDDPRVAVLREACAELLADPAVARFRLREFTRQEVARLHDDLELERYLHYRFRYEVFPREHRLDGFPPLLQIEPTSICNFRCVFCYQTDAAFTDPKQGHMGLMDMGLFRQIVDEAEGKVEGITLASRGEPLMHKRIGEMLAYLAGKFLAVKMNTNATFLDEAKCHAILQAGIQTLVFSADAAAEPLYSQLRVRGDLEKVMANVRLFHDIREREYPDSRTITRISGVKVSEAQDIDAMEQTWGGLVDQVAFVEYNPWENTYERPVNDITTPCSEYWRRSFVYWDGKVCPCDTDYKAMLAVGNAKSAGVGALWRGERYENLRRLHLAKQRGAVSPCNRCTVV